MSGADSNAAPVADAGGREDVKNRGWPKGKKRYPKSPGAPKQPLSGYVHFLNDRRDAVRRQCPDLSFADISKKLANEWSNLDVVEKQTYVKKAEEDKERYNREFGLYQQTEAYQQFLASQKEREAKFRQEAANGSLKKKKTEGAAKAPAQPQPNEPCPGEAKLTTGHGPGGIQTDAGEADDATDIPIFREEFMEHNKARESELRQLRKQALEFEEQNAILHKHVENMKVAISKLEHESSQHKEQNAVLERHLDALRKLVVVNFGGLTLPTPASPCRPLTVDNVDEFVEQLHSLVMDKPRDNERLVEQVKDITRNMDYSSVSS